MNDFNQWFETTTGNPPFPFQRQFATGNEIPELVNVPTGLGKTAMAILGWLWRRLYATEDIKQQTPRRLVYCLPMRVLVEQTYDNVIKWLNKLDLVAENRDDNSKIAVQVLMGGENEEDWDLFPEKSQIIIGTQDMLLSRVLNRGYAATRARWPVQFGLLNNDCLWVFDEIQLMGSGLATTAQFEAFRRSLPGSNSIEATRRHGCQSVWMSATMQPEWLKTVNFESSVDTLNTIGFSFEHEISTPDTAEKAKAYLQKLREARKPLYKASSMMKDAAGLAKEILDKHHPGCRTIVIVNTVERARNTFEALKKETGITETRRGKKNQPELEINTHNLNLKPELVLLHSRFRPEDRKKQIDKAITLPGEAGTIIVSTQVIEAGVDISATTLFTELAPWASLVQRFGRCNRYGDANDIASAYYLPMPDKQTDKEKLAKPYDIQDLEGSEKILRELTCVGVKSLPEIPLPFEHTHVIRRKDLVELFDTTPDLAGNDIDIDRFIRNIDESDVRVFWRDYDKTPNATENKEAEPAPKRDELCSVPIGEFKEFTKTHSEQIWRWNFLDNRWDSVRENQIVPGQIFLVYVNAGGYISEEGWNKDSKVAVNIELFAEKGTPSDATDVDNLSTGIWQSIAQHTDDGWKQLNSILSEIELSSEDSDALLCAIRWHDRGKAHKVFQEALPDDAPDTDVIWAKAKGKWKKYKHPHFRHELASALSVLDPRNNKIPDELRDLVAYLIAVHHGKVRLSIRSLPNETRPDGNRRFARGIWDDDNLPETDLGGGITAPEVKLSLEPMELGLCEEEPFKGKPSWAERMLRLRDRIGPFRLAYLEAILRAADMRASRKADQRMADKLTPGFDRQSRRFIDD